MLLTHRRLGPLFFCLAGMEMAWFTPFFLLLCRPLGGSSLGITFLELFATLLAFILVLELLNLFQVDWPFYELAVVGLILVSTLLFVRLWLYPGLPLADLGWLGNTLGALFDFRQGIRPEWVLILTSAFLWQRAANATSRDTGFFSVGLSFRLGLLLLILGATLFSTLSGQDARLILWLYLGLGLTGVALARTQEKATDKQSIGALPLLRRQGQLLLAVGVTVAATAWLSLFYTPDGIKRTLLVWLKPLGMLVQPLLQLLAWLLEPVLTWLIELLYRWLAGLDWSFAAEFLESLSQNLTESELVTQSEAAPLNVPPWVWAVLRYFLVLLVIGLAVGLILLFLDRARAKPERGETEEEGGEDITLGGATLGRGIRWLRDMAGLVQRFGLSRQLLAAISVQNIYANLCRLARQRGYARRPAQPPDDYLPVLAQAFAGQEAPLARITAAYMQVHYGDQPVSATELAQLRGDYQQVRGSG